MITDIITGYNDGIINLYKRPLSRDNGTIKGLLEKKTASFQTSCSSGDFACKEGGAPVISTNAAFISFNTELSLSKTFGTTKIKVSRREKEHGDGISSPLLLLKKGRPSKLRGDVCNAARRKVWKVLKVKL